MLPPTVERLFDDLADVLNVFHAVHVLYEDLQAYRRRHDPVRLNISINGLRGTGMSIDIPNDQKFSIHVTFDDAFALEVADPAATVTITSSDPSVATVGPHPDHSTGDAEDDQWAEGTVVAGSGSFTVDGAVTLSSGVQLGGSSDPLNVTPGAPAVAHVEVELEAKS